VVPLPHIRPQLWCSVRPQARAMKRTAIIALLALVAALATLLLASTVP
jgi:hypothetical protein